MLRECHYCQTEVKGEGCRSGGHIRVPQMDCPSGQVPTGRSGRSHYDRMNKMDKIWDVEDFHTKTRSHGGSLTTNHANGANGIVGRDASPRRPGCWLDCIRYRLSSEALAKEGRGRRAVWSCCSRPRCGRCFLFLAGPSGASYSDGLAARTRVVRPAGNMSIVSFERWDWDKRGVGRWEGGFAEAASSAEASEDKPGD